MSVKKEKQIRNVKQKLILGDNSFGVQIVADNLIVTNDDLARNIRASNFREFAEVAKEQIEKNHSSFSEQLKNLLCNLNLNFDVISIINSPDCQYISKVALIMAGRSSLEELHKILALLLIERINQDGDDLRRILYNEAIEKIGKITSNQLKMLVFCYLVREKIETVQTKEQFELHLTSAVEFFSNFNPTSADIEYISYLGCRQAPISAFSTNSLEEIIQCNYPEIFPDVNEIQNILDSTKFKIIKESASTIPIGTMTLSPVGKIIANTCYKQVTSPV